MTIEKLIIIYSRRIKELQNNITVNKVDKVRLEAQLVILLMVVQDLSIVANA